MLVTITGGKESLGKLIVQHYVYFRFRQDGSFRGRKKMASMIKNSEKIISIGHMIILKKH